MLRGIGLLYCVLWLFLAGCTRPVGEPSTIKFKLPETGQAIQTKAAAQATTSDWGLSNPSSLSEISCYAVLVSTPDSGHKCSDGDTNLFSISQINGFYPAGSLVSVTVTSGSDRTFRLLGLTSVSSADCLSSLNGLTDLSRFSTPLVLAERTLNLKPGVIEIEMQATLSNVRVRKCDGPGAGFGNTSSSGSVSVLILSPAPNQYINTSNETSFAISGTCSVDGQPVEISGAGVGSAVCTSGSWSTVLNLSSAPQGSTPITVTHADGNGNVATDTRMFQKDTAIPSVGFTSPAPDSLIDAGNQSAFVVNGTCSENGKSVTITGDANGSAICTSGLWSTSLDFSGSPDGTITIFADLTDDAGNAAAQAIRSFLKSTNAAVLTISDGPTYNFGTQPISSSTDKTFTVMNSGTATATSINAVSLTTPFSFKGGGYPGTGGSCASSLAAGSSCTIVVTFSPIGATSYMATINIDYHDGLNNQVVSRNIQGAGQNPAVLAINHDPGYNFGTLTPATSIDQIFTIQNSSDAEATSMVPLPLSDAFSFKDGSYPGTGGTCGSSLPGWSSCTVVVTFSPPYVGYFNQTLSISYFDSSSPQQADRTMEGYGGFNDITISSLQVETPKLDHINITVSFTGDDNSDATVTAYWCNETDNPGCDPMTGGSVPLSRSTNTFYKMNHLLSMMDNPGDLLKVKVMATDFDGVNGGPLETTVELFSYRFVMAGGQHTCAIISGTDEVECWGRGQEGQLGNGGFGDSSLGQLISGFWHFLSSYQNTTCGIDTSNIVYCWGAGGYGQIGNGSTNDQSSPVLTDDGMTWEKVAVGESHVCGLTAGNEIYCWGANNFGQLGIDSFDDQTTPTLVPGTWLDVAAGGNTTCALTTGNAAYCWGDNEYGQVGDGSSNGSFSVPTSVYGGHTFMKIAVGGSHSCAINDSSELWCWGRGVSGQLGDSTFNSYSEPVQEANSGSNWEDVFLGAEHTCARVNSGSVYCWGDNSAGQLGDGTTTSQSTPTLVPGHNFVSLAVGQYHACGIADDKKLYCWGRNSSGQLGTGSTGSDVPTPTPVAP